MWKTKSTPHRWNRRMARGVVVWHLTFSMLASPILFSGCAASRDQWKKTVHNDTSAMDHVSSQIDNPSPGVFNQVSMTSEPVTALTIDEADVTYVDMTLNEVLNKAMEHSSVLRDIGGIVLRSPDSANTGFSTRLQETDPRFGMEAALSAFDAQLAASANFNNNDRIFNNSFFAGGATAFQQDLHDYQVELSKRTATGSRLAIRGVTGYDSNNAPANTFTSAWDTWLEGEIRQPLLQGGGLEFNRIAGPGGTPGVYNGIVIAKANSDINHAEFMASLRSFVSNVENAYWDLYASYRELDAHKKAMEKALVTWNEAKANKGGGSSSIGDEALARQQYYQLKASVDEALSGRLLQGTQTQNGSGGGTFQMSGGVLAAERRLRLLTGMPAANGQLLRPLDEPSMAQIHFDWHSSMNEAIQQRPELQRQHIVVKKKELELLAARNFLNPRLDAIGRYRWRGFGDDFIGDGVQSGTAPASALGNLANGDQQEWTLGVELTVPIGYRQAHAAVQNAELSLSRSRVIQKEQQREIVSDLNGAITDAVRAFRSVENNLNQYLAAKDYLETLETRKANGQNDQNDRLPDAQRRLVQAEIQFFRARSEYAVALKNVHYEKGSLLRYKDLRVADAAQSFEYSEAMPEMIEGGPVEFAAPPATMESSDSGILTVPGDSSSPNGDGVPPVPPPNVTTGIANPTAAAASTVAAATPQVGVQSSPPPASAPVRELAPMLDSSTSQAGVVRIANSNESPATRTRSAVQTVSGSGNPPQRREVQSRSPQRTATPEAGWRSTQSEGTRHR